MAEEIILKFKADQASLDASFNQLEKAADDSIKSISDKPLKLKIDFNAADAELKKIANNAPALKSMLENLKSQIGAATDKKTFDELSRSIRVTESALTKLTGETTKLDSVTQKYTDRLNVVNTKINEWQKTGLGNTAGFSKLLREQELLTKKLGNTTTTSFGQSEERVISLRGQLRAAREEVAQLSLKFGATSAEAIQAAEKASLLADAIEDASDLTKAFNPDAKFAALTGSIQGVASGFQVVQGAIGAFGSKSEEVEKALLKVNSAMALSQGLQGLFSSIDSFKNLGSVIKSTTVFQTLYNFVMGEKVAIQQTDVATTVAATVATRAQAAATNTATIATTASSTAMKVLRGALIATGIGALVVLLGSVIANFDSISAWINKSPLGAFTRSVGNLVQKFTDLVGITSQTERQFSSLQKFTKLKNEGIERQIKLLTAQGGKEAEIAKLQKESTQNEINLLAKKVDKKGALYGEDAKKYKDLQNNLAVIDAEENKRQTDEAKKASEKASEDRKKANEKAEDDRKKANEKAIKDEKEKNDEIIKQRDRLIAQVEKPQEAKKAEIDNLIARGASKEEIAKANEELLQLEIDYANKVNIIRSDANQNLTANFKENIDARDKEIVTSFEENKKITELEIELENKKIENKIAASQIVDESAVKELQRKKQLLSETETLNDKEKQDKETQLLEIEALILQSQNRVLQLKIDGAIKAGALENGETIKALKEQLKTNQELIDKNQRDINKNRKKNQDKADKDEKEKFKEKFNLIAEFASNGILLEIGLNPSDVNKVKATIEDLQKTLADKDAKPGEKAEKAAQAAGAVAQTISNAVFAADTKRREEELAALQVQQEEELRLAGDNEQKKDLIRQKYALKEKQIKTKQAEADKRKAIFDAIINTAVAVVTGFVKGGPILAAIAAALGAAQIAIIAAQPIPKFAKGGQITDGLLQGKPHSSGGILLEAEGNEYITNKKQSMSNLGLLEAINMSDEQRDKYINAHYVLPALKQMEANESKGQRESMLDAENNLIARVSSATLRNIHKEQRNTTEAVKNLSKNKNYNW